MRFPAQIEASITCLKSVLNGTHPNIAIRQWGNQHRFAGSKDRQAIRDICFDVMRKKRALGYGLSSPTARGLVKNWAYSLRYDIDAIFTGREHSPAPLTGVEREELAWQDDIPLTEASNLPEWLREKLAHDYPQNWANIAHTLSQKAGLDLRVNERRISRENAVNALQKEGFEVDMLKSASALRIIGKKRSIETSILFKEGMIELQDAHSQDISRILADYAKGDVLDYCAGGGGKALALKAFKENITLSLWDSAPARLDAAFKRAERSKTELIRLKKDPFSKGGAQRKQYDFIYLDVPCSGSGAWRRDVMGRWDLTPQRLEELKHTQQKIVREACGSLRINGLLAFITCSLFYEENLQIINQFPLETWEIIMKHQFLPSDSGDGFFIVIVKKHE